MQPAPIANKEEKGSIAFVKKGETATVKKDPKGKCHRCGMVNDYFLSDCKVVSEEANKIIMAAKREEWQAKKGLVAT